jgi:Family of unknown function (DUF6092)
VATELDTSLFRVLAYLVGSASITPSETLPLGSYRLLDATSRLIDMAESSAAFGPDEFLVHIRAEITEHANMVMWDQPAFLRWLAALEAEMVREARRRNLSEPA